MAQPAPQPASLEGFGDQIGFFDRAVRQHGPIIQFPMGPQLTGMLIASADGADRVLRAEAERYPKGMIWAVVSRLTGQGLSTNEDLEDWRRQRRLMNPAFSRTSVQYYVDDLHDVIRTQLDAWAESAGAPVNITESSAELTQAMILRTLFGTGIDQAERARVGAALVAVLGEIARLSQIGDPSAPMSAEADEAIAYIDTIIARLTATYRERLSRGETPEPHLMGQLIAATDEQGSMSPERLRDELMVSFLAGYETTALTLQWALYLLARHPEAAARLDDEIAAFGERIPTYEDLKDLPYLQAVLNETLRLYPALPYIPRQRTFSQPDTIDGYEVPAGAVILVSAWHIHRDPAHWGDDAADYRPERWHAEGSRPGERSKAAFLPFSMGGRICIGEHLSRVGLALALVSIRQRFACELVEQEEAYPVALFTLRPQRDIQVCFSPRRAPALS